MPLWSLFTKNEIDAYLEHIQLPSEYRTSSTTPRDLSFLTKLHIHHITHVPFENLPIHYSQAHTIDVNPRAVYAKIMSKRGRGGQCMELNYLLTHILHGLGFNVYPTGARVRPRVNGVPGGAYTGWTHALNIVTFDSGEKYIVDVAFGGDCITRPLRLVENTAATNLGTQEVRYVQGIVGELGSQKMWQYHVRNSKEQEWMTHYCFSETEFIAADFEVMNFWTSTHPTSFHVTGIFVIKFLNEGGEIVGKVMLANGTVKENLGGKSRTIKECRTEEERVQTLAEVFGLKLTKEEQKAIQGRATELKSL